MEPTLTESITQQSDRIREPVDVRKESHSPQLQQRINVGNAERWLSFISGMGLGLYGLTRKTPGGLITAAVGGALAYRGLSGHSSLYQILDISTSGQRRALRGVPASRGIKVEVCLTVNRPAVDLYQFWRNFENLGHFMSHLQSVQITDENRSHWIARGPLGYQAEWDAEIFNEHQNELIAWRSLEGSTIGTAGSVHFKPAPGDRGTEVSVSLKYDPPVGKVGNLAAWLFGEAPEQTVREDLRRFKQFMETGEIPTTKGQPRGLCQ